jgi:quinolinate synthase
MSKKYVIAAHHYQTPEIVERADMVGDSYRLAVEAAKLDAEYTILCGVRFMAESVAILAQAGQKVLMPEIAAGCPMADMVSREDAVRALATIREQTGKDTVPITYMNSWADTKAFTGEEGGSICTSGNADKIVRHYLEQGKNVFFLPDYNLGMNTARKLGINREQICAVRRDGSLDASSEALPHTRVFLWDGFCPIHMAFRPNEMIDLRARHPGMTIIVHPECTPETANAANMTGSTEQIYRALKEAPAGSTWAVGTEICFVQRMAQEFPNKQILPLTVSRCKNMSMTSEESLDNLEALLTRHLAGEKQELPLITVPEEYIQPARAALETMVRITEA